MDQDSPEFDEAFERAVEQRVEEAAGFYSRNRGFTVEALSPGAMPEAPTAKDPVREALRRKRGY